MPWKTRTAMEERMCFVMRSREPGANVSELCREFCISRSTGNKWIKRYEEEGVKGLYERSRRPRNSPLATSSEMVCAIVSYKHEYPRRGAEKIRHYLLNKYDEDEVPSIATVNRVLGRCGLVQRRSKRLQRSVYEGKLTRPSESNEVWTADYKGWWRTKRGQRCEPLTIRDEYSRFVLDISAQPSTSMERAKERFRCCFQQFGQPCVIRTDNGAPFASLSSISGLTRLSVWWIKLGITPERIPPGQPYHNGAHERLHRDMAYELEVNPAQDLFTQQQVFDEWRHEFNTERPHSALKMKSPADVYRISSQQYDPREPAYEYPDGYDVRKIDSSGRLNWRNKRISLSKSLAGEHIAITQTDDDTFAVWYCDYYLGKTDKEFRFLTPPEGGVRTLSCKNM